LLIKEHGWRKVKAPLVVVSAAPPPPPKSGEVIIEGKVTHHGNPVPEAMISFVRVSSGGGNFVDDKWKTNADGSFRIVTKKLWAGEYKVHAFKQGTSFGRTMWSKEKKEPKITVLAGKSASFGPCDIEMETMREKYGITIPGGF
jgi:hypothetical protein